MIIIRGHGLKRISDFILSFEMINFYTTQMISIFSLKLICLYIRQKLIRLECKVCDMY